MLEEENIGKLNLIHQNFSFQSLYILSRKISHVVASMEHDN